MNFGNMGFMEILLILVVVLLLFGAKRLPEIGSSMGKGIREFKKSISDVDRSLREPERGPHTCLENGVRFDVVRCRACELQRADQQPEKSRRVGTADLRSPPRR